LHAAGQAAEATLAWQTLARLELRRGELKKALAAGRNALRAAREAASDSLVEQSHDLLARLYSHAGAHQKALAQAEEWREKARERGDERALAHALHRLALVSWAAGDAARALSLAEEALDAAARSDAGRSARQTDRLMGCLLLQSGCPTAAERRFTRSLRRTEQAEEKRRLWLARGWAWFCLGRLDAAARDFRRAQGQARELADKRGEVEASAALAAAESRRARLEGNTARLGRAEALADRARRQSLRLKDPYLQQFVQALQDGPEGAGAAEPNTGGLAATCKEAAQLLVELARETMSLTAVDACLREVERLASLPEGERPYHCDSLLSQVFKRDLLEH
jgi:tetratricopeptide (TPR) repeat protein